MQQPGLDFHNIPTPLIQHPGGVRRVVRGTPPPAFVADSRVLLGLELRQPRRGRWAVILPDMRGSPPACKVQLLTRRGFGRQVSGFADPWVALRAARALGFTEDAPGIVETLAASSRWRRRYGRPVG